MSAQTSELPRVAVRGAESTLPFRDREIDCWSYNFNRACLHYKFPMPSPSIGCAQFPNYSVLYLNDAFNATLQNSFVIHASEHVLYQCCITRTQKGLISADGNITSIQSAVQLTQIWVITFDMTAFMWIISCISDRLCVANLLWELLIRAAPLHIE